MEYDVDFPCEENEDLKMNRDLMVVEINAMTLDSTFDPEIGEISQLSLEGVNISAHEVNYCSQWVINNVNKFRKKMGVSLDV